MTSGEIDLVLKIVGRVQEIADNRIARGDTALGGRLNELSAVIFDEFLPDDDDVLDALQFDEIEVFDEPPIHFGKPVDFSDFLLALFGGEPTLRATA